jgi:hypothetical protein
MLQLSVTHTITVDEDTIGKSLVYLVVLGQCS